MCVFVRVTFRCFPKKRGECRHSPSPNRRLHPTRSRFDSNRGWTPNPNLEEVYREQQRPTREPSPQKKSTFFRPRVPPLVLECSVGDRRVTGFTKRTGSDFSSSSLHKRWTVPFQYVPVPFPHVHITMVFPRLLTLVTKLWGHSAPGVRSSMSTE